MKVSDLKILVITSLATFENCHGKVLQLSGVWSDGDTPFNYTFEPALELTPLACEQLGIKPGDWAKAVPFSSRSGAIRGEIQLADLIVCFGCKATFHPIQGEFGRRGEPFLRIQDKWIIDLQELWKKETKEPVANFDLASACEHFLSRGAYRLSSLEDRTKAISLLLRAMMRKFRINVTSLTNYRASTPRVKARQFKKTVTPLSEMYPGNPFLEESKAQKNNPFR